MGKARETTQAYAIGQQVTGKVYKRFRYGIFVRLDDGSQAYIRRREMSWEGDIDPRKLVQTGQEIKAVVLDLGESDRNMELSFKAVLPDPWEKFIQQYQEGDVVAGEIRRLTSFGAFVQILPGVDGLVPLQELAPWPVEKVEDVVWVRDNVEAVIKRIDRKARQVQLSIRTRLRWRETTTAVLEELYRTQEVEPEPEIPLPGTAQDLTSRILDPAIVEQIGRILVVEDEDQVRLSLAKWLQNLGCEADVAENTEEAEEKIRQRSYGLLLVDIQLPSRNGLTFIQQIREQGNNDAFPVAVMSIPEWIEKYADEIEQLDVLEVFTKPLNLDEVEHLLLKIRSGERVSPWQATVRQAAVSGSSRALTDIVHTGTSLDDRLRLILEQHMEDVQADAGIIFHLDQLSQVISIKARAGAIGSLPERETAYLLKESPVRDVIFEGETVFEHRMNGGVAKRFRKLLDLLSFESCIGVPIEVGGETRCALFLFHRKSRAFSHYRLRDARAAAVLIAAVIEREILTRQFQSIGRLLLSGELAAGLSHEVSNKMSGLEIQLRNLRTDWERLNQQAPDLTKHLGFAERQQALDTLLRTAEDLKRTVGGFRRLMRAGEEQKLNVNDVVRGAEMLLRPTAHRAGITVKTELGSGLPPVKGSGARLQQAFLNVMLNAVQQMELVSRSGVLRVTTFFESHDGARPIKVRFSDGGPGIHKRLWKEIFALGFSTRPEGTGQGLFIARSLVGSMGGRISVEESLVPLGTTFLVELPALAQ